MRRSYKITIILWTVASLVLIAQSINSSELIHKFGSPSFNGQGQSAHYLTIDEQERTRQTKIFEDAQSALEDIAESLFNYGTVATGDEPVMGTINLEGNQLTWINDGTTITLIIEEYVDGVLVGTTEIVIPVGDFGGCWAECG